LSFVVILKYTTR